MIALSIGFLLLVRIWNHTGPRWAQPIVGPLAAALLILLSGLTPAELGLTLSGAGYALSGATAIAVGYGLALLIPPARRALAEAHHPRPMYSALAGVPLATVIFEEVAFRGVLWALIAGEHGPAWATGVTAVLFGLWHLPPSTRVLLTKFSVGTVAFTTLAGLALGLLRDVSGGLLAPSVVHWTANGLGILVSAAFRADAAGRPPGGRGARQRAPEKGR